MADLLLEYNQWNTKAMQPLTEAKAGFNQFNLYSKLLGKRKKKTFGRKSDQGCSTGKSHLFLSASLTEGADNVSTTRDYRRMPRTPFEGQAGSR